ncbi:MAG TPA: potassium-transporting ATPase subunit C [Acidimicrobiales bacterium]|jgi:K+-transporting ATPase ATPase C chain|nr:potassium-transporting ATPase subunit C [Acidimicrobiales bacterium]
MLVHLRRSVLAGLALLLLVGLAYPLAGTGISLLAFRHQAEGSLTADGSTLIGQAWPGPRWFEGRPSATLSAGRGPDGIAVSGAANLGPRSRALAATVAREAARWRSIGVAPTADLVTTSGSGLDPDISPADAFAEAPAVARARHLPLAEVRRLVATQVHGAEFGFLGEPYVDVLELNLALARLR